MNEKKRSRGIEILLLLAVLVSLLLFFPRLFRRNVTTSSPETKPAVPTTKPLRVGLYLSQMTGEKWGVSCQIVAELSRGGFDLVPILEPGSESYEPITNQLNIWFRNKPAVDATNAEALKKLDVIVAPRIWNMPDEAVAAITAAVENGTGLLARNGIGCMEPGTGDAVSKLSGFQESSFGYNPHPMECEIIGSHIILGNLAASVGKSITLTPNGTWGIPNAKLVPLIRIKEMDKFHEFESRGGDDWTFYPLYVAELGKGRILGCQFPAWSPMPRDLMLATGDQFNIRAVRWLAHQLDEPTTARAAPAERMNQR